MLMSTFAFSFPITVSFKPLTDKEVNFNLCCKIKSKAEPLMINIKAEGYTMECLVLCENSAGQKIEISADHRNEIHFDQVNSDVVVEATESRVAMSLTLQTAMSLTLQTAMSLTL